MSATTSTGPGRLRSIQALRGVAVGLVVWAHLSAPHGVEARWLDGPRLTAWMRFPTMIGVDLFFVISGVIIMTTTWPSFAQPGGWRRFAYRRATRIYPLYWVVTSLVLVVWLLRPGWVNSSSVHDPEVLPSFLILPQPGDPLLAVGWTLVYELYFYGVFTVALLFARRRLPWILGGWAAATVALHLAFPHPGDPWLGTVANPIVLEFVLGVGVGALLVRGWMPAPRALAAAAAVAVLAAVLPVAIADHADWPSGWYRALVVGGALAAVVLAAAALELRRGARFPKALVRTGDGSYSIYLWHVPILSVAGRVLGGAIPGTAPVKAAALVAFFVVAIAISLRLYDAVERPLLRAFHTRRFRRTAVAATAPAEA